MTDRWCGLFSRSGIAQRVGQVALRVEVVAYTVFVEKEAAWYVERLDRYDAMEREQLEQAEKIKSKENCGTRKATPVKTEKAVSATDPGAGFLQRPGKPNGVHFLEHQSVDGKNGIIIGEKVHFTC